MNMMIIYNQANPNCPLYRLITPISNNYLILKIYSHNNTNNNNSNYITPILYSTILITIISTSILLLPKISILKISSGPKNHESEHFLYIYNIYLLPYFYIILYYIILYYIIKFVYQRASILINLIFLTKQTIFIYYIDIDKLLY